MFGERTEEANKTVLEIILISENRFTIFSVVSFKRFALTLRRELVYSSYLKRPVSYRN